MDAASLLNTARWSLLAWLILTSVSAGQDRDHRNAGFESQSPARLESASVPSFAKWLGQWFSQTPRLSVRFAIHEAAADGSAETVAPCGHQICAGNKCYDAATDADDKPCQHCKGPAAATEETDDEPIVEVPAAPPLPPSYQFTGVDPNQPAASHVQVALESLQGTQVRVPATVLVALLVDHARSETQLAMTREMMEERTAFLDQLREISEQNARLRTQIAMMELQQIAEMNAQAEMASIAPEGATPPIATDEESSVGLQAIQEDLSNIRKQIAILKRNHPVPFAPSYIGANPGYRSTWLSPPRTARVAPYIPLSPQAQADSNQPEEAK